MTERVGDTMRALFERTGLSQHEIARLGGLSYATLHAWVNGRRNPSPESVRAIADGLDKRGSDLEQIAAELRRLADATG
jgi:transcriptional regulator with XRE-family HTH domain